ncbi:MAG: type II toxin-antitoxin system HicA family toxin [Betaproteobacteria bacterium]|nr:type II toxin-antitoxin system HicA family toxin [Betaproteobacteria bacterium]
MSKLEKWLLAVLSGASDSNLPFSDLRGLLLRLDFEERVRGSHHIFSRPDVAEILNLQERGGKAKPYQVRQVRDVILKYRMARFNDE